MSFLIMAQAMQVKTGSAVKKIILLRLADQANDDGVCFPSVRSLSEYTELSPRTVQINIRQLEEAGLIVRHSRKSENGRSTSNYYTLHLDQAEKIARTQSAGNSHSNGGRVQEMQGLI